MRLLVEPAKVGALVFVAAILQVSIFSTFQPCRLLPDIHPSMPLLWGVRASAR